MVTEKRIILVMISNIAAITQRKDKKALSSLGRQPVTRFPSRKCRLPYHPSFSAHLLPSRSVQKAMTPNARALVHPSNGADWSAGSGMYLHTKQLWEL